MRRAQQFTFGPFHLDTDNSVITFSYRTDLMSGGREEYINALEIPSATKEMWERLPQRLVRSLLEALSLINGINYWKIHCAPKIRIEGFSLTKEQAEFWNTVYTKGLGEFFFRSQIDFRGLVSFPYEAGLKHPGPIHTHTRPISLVLNGGGKDTVVSAEMLKQKGDAFDLFTHNPVEMQRSIALRIGRPLIGVLRRPDRKLTELQKEKKLVAAFPSIIPVLFAAFLAAALHGYRQVVTSNESSADEGNTTYLGMEVNHQWSKTTESERMINEYMASFITPSISTFSLLRGFTELENTRRFARYPQYFKTFSSCNVGFWFPDRAKQVQAAGRSYWCGACPKCAFIFSSLSAFLPKETVVDIFGANLYAEKRLLPMFRRLLGIEGFKPFECVGSAEETIVAMESAARTGSYDSDVVIQMYKSNFDISPPAFEQMKHRVLSLEAAEPIQNTLTLSH
jgi:hypothetical protein